MQAVIFTGEHFPFSSGRSLATILTRFQDRFDGEVQVLPLPSDVPPELPRVQLRSADQQWHLAMGPARIDSFWKRASGTSRASLHDLAVECAEVQEHYVEQMRIPVGRVALVVHRTCCVDNPAQVLVERFCNEASKQEPLHRSKSFEVHNHKVYAPKRRGVDYSVNSWVRCKSDDGVADSRPVILVVQDLNTLAPESASRRFDRAKLHGFVEMAAAEADEILSKYFPV